MSPGPGQKKKHHCHTQAAQSSFVLESHSNDSPPQSFLVSINARSRKDTKANLVKRLFYVFVREEVGHADTTIAIFFWFYPEFCIFLKVDENFLF